MTRALQFFQPMVPPKITHNALEVRYRSDGGKRVPYIGKSDALKQAEAKWHAYLGRHAPDRPFSGPVRVEYRICWPTGGKHAQGEPMTAKPDNDNSEKVLNDALVRLGFLADDRFIASNETMKMWSDPAGIFVRIEEIAL